jgi:uncharacterized protein (TIGR02599 family)
MFRAHKFDIIDFLRNRAGFTLLELLVSLTILSIIVVMLLQIINSASTNWQKITDNAKAFESARAAFELLQQTLSQATLATEYDYYDSSRIARLSISNNATLAAFTPSTYGRYSSLHFVAGKSLLPTNHTHALFFQAPLNFVTNSVSSTLPSSGLLNATGFYIKYSDDKAYRPSNLTDSSPPLRNRFRLMQYFQPTENLDVYRDGSASSWFLNDLEANSRPISENIVALVLLPTLPDGTQAAGYEYNSRTNWPPGNQPAQMHQLPLSVKVLMVAIDERTAQRDPTLGSACQSLFQNPAQLEANLTTVETTLRNAGANYKIFRTEVPLRAAKWSE